MHTPIDGEGNLMATQQTLLALLALEKAESGNGWIFDFTQYQAPEIISSGSGLGGNIVVILAGTTAAVLIIGVVLGMSQKKRAGKE